jgi:hypothetical protein
VKPGDPVLPEHKEAAQDRKENKDEVKRQNEISKNTCPHLLIP